MACVGVPPVPRVIRWTDHAIAKAHALGVTQADVEADVLEHHAKRRANTGAAAWLLIVGRLVVAATQSSASNIGVRAARFQRTFSPCLRRRRSA